MYNKNFIDALHYFYFYDSPASQETLTSVVIIEQNSRKKQADRNDAMAGCRIQNIRSQDPFTAFCPCRFVSLTDLGKSGISRELL